MKLKNPSSVGLAFILIGLAIVFVVGLLYSYCVGTSYCSSNGLVLTGVIFSLGTTMIIAGAILAAAGHIADYLQTKS